MNFEEINKLQEQMEQQANARMQQMHTHMQQMQEEERARKKRRRNKIILIIIGIFIGIKILKVIFYGLVVGIGAMASSPVARAHVLHLLLAIVVMVVATPLLWIWYNKERMNEDPIYRMQQYDKGGVFTKEIAKAQNYYESLNLHRVQNKHQKISNETVRNAYDEIYQKIENRLEAISKHIEHFDYIAYKQADSATYNEIGVLLDEIDDLIDKLNRLDTLNIKIENSTLDNDTDRIKFLIESLEELSEEDK